MDSMAARVLHFWAVGRVDVIIPCKTNLQPSIPSIRIVPLSRFFRAKRGRFPCANPGRLPLMRQSEICPISPIRAFLRRVPACG